MKPRTLSKSINKRLCCFPHYLLPSFVFSVRAIKNVFSLSFFLFHHFDMRVVNFKAREYVNRDGNSRMFWCIGFSGPMHVCPGNRTHGVPQTFSVMLHFYIICSFGRLEDPDMEVFVVFMCCTLLGLNLKYHPKYRNKEHISDIYLCQGVYFSTS